MGFNLKLKKILAVDFGLKRIGLAISDANQKIALPLKTLCIPNPNQAVSLVARAIKEQLNISGLEIEKIVLGHPLLLSGKEGEMAKNVTAFKQKLENKLGFLIPIVLWDERLSSAQAEKLLKKDFSRKKRKQMTDPIAAMLVLQSFLENQENFS